MQNILFLNKPTALSHKQFHVGTVIFGDGIYSGQEWYSRIRLWRQGEECEGRPSQAYG